MQNQAYSLLNLEISSSMYSSEGQKNPNILQKTNLFLVKEKIEAAISQIIVIANIPPKNLKKIATQECSTLLNYYQDLKTNQYVQFPRDNAFEVYYMGECLHSKLITNTFPIVEHLIIKINTIRLQTQFMEDNYIKTPIKKFFKINLSPGSPNTSNSPRILKKQASPIPAPTSRRPIPQNTLSQNKNKNLNIIQNSTITIENRNSLVTEIPLKADQIFQVQKLLTPVNLNKSGKSEPQNININIIKVNNNIFFQNRKISPKSLKLYNQSPYRSGRKLNVSNQGKEIPAKKIINWFQNNCQSNSPQKFYRQSYVGQQSSRPQSPNIMMSKTRQSQSPVYDERNSVQDMLQNIQKIERQMLQHSQKIEQHIQNEKKNQDILYHSQVVKYNQQTPYVNKTKSKIQPQNQYQNRKQSNKDEYVIQVSSFHENNNDSIKSMHYEDQQEFQSFSSLPKMNVFKDQKYHHQVIYSRVFKRYKIGKILLKYFVLAKTTRTYLKNVYENSFRSYLKQKPQVLEKIEEKSYDEYTYNDDFEQAPISDLDADQSIQNIKEQELLKQQNSFKDSSKNISMIHSKQMKNLQELDQQEQIKKWSRTLKKFTYSYDMEDSQKDIPNPLDSEKIIDITHNIDLDINDKQNILDEQKKTSNQTFKFRKVYRVYKFGIILLNYFIISKLGSQYLNNLYESTIQKVYFRASFIENQTNQNSIPSSVNNIGINQLNSNSNSQQVIKQDSIVQKSKSRSFVQGDSQKISSSQFIIKSNQNSIISQIDMDNKKEVSSQINQAYNESEVIDEDFQKLINSQQSKENQGEVQKNSISSQIDDEDFQKLQNSQLNADIKVGQISQQSILGQIFGDSQMHQTLKADLVEDNQTSQLNDDLNEVQENSKSLLGQIFGDFQKLQATQDNGECEINQKFPNQISEQDVDIQNKKLITYSKIFFRAIKKYQIGLTLLNHFRVIKISKAYLEGLYYNNQEDEYPNQSEIQKQMNESSFQKENKKSITNLDKNQSFKQNQEISDEETITQNFRHQSQQKSLYQELKHEIKLENGSQSFREENKDNNLENYHKSFIENEHENNEMKMQNIDTIRDFSMLKQDNTQLSTDQFLNVNSEQQLVYKSVNEENQQEKSGNSSGEVSVRITKVRPKLKVMRSLNPKHSTKQVQKSHFYRKHDDDPEQPNESKQSVDQQEIYQPKSESHLKYEKKKGNKFDEEDQRKYKDHINQKIIDMNSRITLLDELMAKQTPEPPPTVQLEQVSQARVLNLLNAGKQRKKQIQNEYKMPK